MSIHEWLVSGSQETAMELVKINNEQLENNKISGFGMKNKVIELLTELKTALFPTIYEKHSVDDIFLSALVNKRLYSAAILLNNIAKQVLIQQCELEEKNTKTCHTCFDRADEMTVSFMKKLTDIRRVISTDIVAAYNGDPAAKYTEEILLSYPSLEAVTTYRLAHELFLLKLPLVPRVMTEYAHAQTGIDIHPGATIGHHFFIDHGTGVVIGETCTIGNHVKLYQGVTLGAKSFELDKNGNPVKDVKRHPDIGDHVVIYSGATILGGSTKIGHGSVIGGNVWITESVQPNSRVYQSAPSPIIK